MRSPEQCTLSLSEKIPSIQRAEGFRDSYLARNPNKAEDPSLAYFFEDLTKGRFWAVMSRVDGDPDYVYRGSDPLSWRDPDELERERRDKKNWAINNFTLSELQRIFDIYLEQALNAPEGTPENAPGSFRGQSIVYEQIINKPNSMFLDQITPELKKRLNNGRFWEELPQAIISMNGGASVAVVSDVLENNYEALDVSFAAEGFKIINRGQNELGESTDLTHLSERGLDNYLDFIRRIDASKDDIGVTRKQVSSLIAPYVEVVLSTHKIDNESLRFGEVSIDDGLIKPEKDYKERLEDPLVQDYIETEAVEKILTERLGGIIENNSFEASAIFSRLPNAQEIWENIISSHVDYSPAFQSVKNELQEIIANRRTNRN